MPKWKLLGAAVLAATAAITCEKVPLTAAPGSTLTLIANPEFVPANGGRSLVTAILVEPAGTFVPDGTEVFFFTNLGQVTESAKTVNGVARVYFVADSRSGTATVTAISGGAVPAPAPSNGNGTTGSATATGGDGSDTVQIVVGSALPARVLVSASPQRITSPRLSTITATVYDEVGNPVQNVPVVLSVGGLLIEETLDSGGRPLFTDSSGQVFDVLRTRAPIGSLQKEVAVTATTANGIDGSVTVFVD